MHAHVTLKVTQACIPHPSRGVRPSPRTPFNPLKIEKIRIEKIRKDKIKIGVMRVEMSAKGKFHGSYDGVIIKYEQRRVKRRFSCGCVILENGERLYCMKHWSRARIKEKEEKKER